MAQGNAPLTRFGNSTDEARYMHGNGHLEEPSLINTNSKFLNNPYFRDAYAQIALRRNGPDVPSTYIIPMAARAIGEVTDYADFQRLIDIEKGRNSEFAEWLASRRDTSFSREQLAHHDQGTLGHAIHELLGISGIEMDLQLKGIVPDNDIDYISKRRGTVHDIEHIVTGFDANACGELALIWQDIASNAAYFSPDLAHHMNAGLVFLATATLQQYSLHYPAVMPTALEAMRQGVAMGQALKRPLIMEPWEDILELQIGEITRRLGIERGPGPAWGWTCAATSG